MLELLSSGIILLWLEMAEINPSVQSLLVWNQAPQLILSTEPDPATVASLQQYLQIWGAKGKGEDYQGVWIQSGYQLLASNQGTTPLPAASLTKIATTLAALKTWGPDYQFTTLLSATGPIENGVLKGDLVVTGGGDPFFVWEDAIALGLALNKLGITRVTGDLLIADKFSMNYQSNRTVAGEMLRQAINRNLWTPEIEARYGNLPSGTPQPAVEISGSVRVPTSIVPNQRLLLRRFSMPLAEILKQMNVHSKNALSEAIANGIGGASVVRKLASESAGVPLEEIQIINGSGLGLENRISPRAAVAMFIAIQRELIPYKLNIANLFPVAGRDEGTLLDRHPPTHSVVKTGSLWEASALAGVLPTRDRGLVWFAIINGGWDIEGFRVQQDEFLQQLVKQWGTVPVLPEAIANHSDIADRLAIMGILERNEIF